MTLKKSLTLLTVLVLAAVPLLIGCSAPPSTGSSAATASGASSQVSRPTDGRFVVRQVTIPYENGSGRQYGLILTDHETGQEYLLLDQYNISPLLGKAAPPSLGKGGQ